MTPNEVLAANMRRLRKTRGWTQKELGSRWGVSLQVVNSLETGHRGREFSVNEAVAVAGIFGLPVADLLMPVLPCTTCQGAPPAGFTCRTCGAESDLPAGAR